MQRLRLRAIPAALLGCLACGQLIGAPDYDVATAGSPGTGSDGASAAPPPIVYDNVACGQCVAEACTAELAACQADPDCAAFAACFEGCANDDGVCQGRCVDTLPIKPSAYKALSSCTALRCTNACADCTKFFSLLGGESCGECIERDDATGGVCDAFRECYEYGECLAYGACLYAECDAFEPDPACRLTCGTRHPEGARVGYTTIGARYFEFCAAACGGGQQWDCTQPAKWPGIPEEGTATVTLHMPAGYVVRPDITARACWVRDPSCAAPISGTASDDGASVVFQLEKVARADQAYYFEFQPEATSSPSLMPPQIFLPWQPLIGDISLWTSAYAATTDALDIVAMTRGGEPVELEASGRVVVWVADCISGFADYLSVAPRLTGSATPGGAPYYGAVTGVLDASLTGGGGVMVFPNVPPPSTSIQVLLDGTDPIILPAVVPIRAGVVTTVTFNYPQFL